MTIFSIQVEEYMLPCLHKKLFGVDCLGCGFQRSLAHIFHGEFLEAFKMYPAIYSMFAFGAFALLHLKFKFKNGKKIIQILAILTITTMLIGYIFKINS